MTRHRFLDSSKPWSQLLWHGVVATLSTLVGAALYWTIGAAWATSCADETDHEWVNLHLVAFEALDEPDGNADQEAWWPESGELEARSSASPAFLVVHFDDESKEFAVEELE